MKKLVGLLLAAGLGAYAFRDDDRVKGLLKKTRGTIDQARGQMTGDSSTELQGEGAQIEGQVQTDWGEVKQSVS